MEELNTSRRARRNALFAMAALLSMAACALLMRSGGQLNSGVPTAPASVAHAGPFDRTARWVEHPPLRVTFLSFTTVWDTYGGLQRAVNLQYTSQSGDVSLSQIILPHELDGAILFLEDGTGAVGISTDGSGAAK